MNLNILLMSITGAGGAAVGVIIAVLYGRRHLGASQQRAQALLEEAKKDAQRLIREAEVEKKDERHRLRVEFEESTRERRVELQKEEKWLLQKKESLDKRVDMIEKKEQQVNDERVKTNLDRQGLEQERERIKAVMQKEEEALQRIAGFSKEEAAKRLMEKLERDVAHDAASLIRRREQESREDAERNARDIIAQAIHRCASDHVAEITVCSVSLPSDDIKGRIIGREGRNIRTLEQETGVEILIDDTPNAVVISGFDPVRREIARVGIQRLLEDGRIHPARIEEVVAKVREEFETLTEEAGAQAAFALGVFDLHPRLARLVGRLKFRAYHGHNLLQHAGEVVHLAAHIAAETGARVDVLRRAALLHEIGRVEDGGSGHPLVLAAELAAKFGERDEVVKAIQSLHPDAEPTSVEALILRVANRISENRPGARKDNLDVFIERLRRVEALACTFPGVTQAIALKAGKELRILVDTKSVTDDQAYSLSKQIARAIERELEYPGTIRVSVVRETRSVQYAV